MSGGQVIDKRQLMSQSSLLRELSAEDLERLVTYVRVAKFAANEVIFRKGDPGHSMMSVITGRVRIGSLSPTGKEAVLNIINPGEVFGEIALLDGKARTADATAMVDSDLLVLERREFIPFLERHPRTCIDLLTVLCGRIRDTTEMVEDTLFLDLPARLGRTLLRLAERHGEETGDGIRIGIKFSQRELGDLVGMTRESINKQLAAWREMGIVKIDRGHILIGDVDALEDVIDGAS